MARIGSHESVYVIGQNSRKGAWSRGIVQDTEIILSKYIGWLLLNSAELFYIKAEALIHPGIRS